jgi:hypothetical protein
VKGNRRRLKAKGEEAGKPRLKGGMTARFYFLKCQPLGGRAAQGRRPRDQGWRLKGLRYRELKPYRFSHSPLEIFLPIPCSISFISILI